MKYMSVTQFVEETNKTTHDISKINIVYNVNNAKQDQFGKLTCTPLIIVLTKNNGEKEILDFNMILERYGEQIKVSLPKPNIEVNGFANMQISTTTFYSEKFNNCYYPKTYATLSQNVVRKAKESQKQQQQHEEGEMLDF